jgi:hypothetical protein
MKTENFARLLAEDLPTRPSRPGAALTGWLLPTAFVAGATFLMIAEPRSDLLGAGLAPTLMKTLLGGLLAWSAVTGARILARPEAAPREGVKRLVFFAVFLGVLLAADLAWRGSAGWGARMLGKSVWACLTIIPALALPALAASLYALRSGATTSPAAAGALAGFASAGLAILAYGLFCTEDSPAFVATWYSLAAVIVAAFGAVLGQRLLRW